MDEGYVKYFSFIQEGALGQNVLGCSRFLANCSQLHVTQVGWKFMQVLCITLGFPCCCWLRIDRDLPLSAFC